MKKIGIIVAATCWSFGAQAQDISRLPAVDQVTSSQDASGAQGKPPTPQTDKPSEGATEQQPRGLCGNFCTFSLEVAPDATSSRPYGEQDYTDALTLNGRLRILRPLIEPLTPGQPNPLEVEMEIGPSFVLDSDDGGKNSSSSSFSVGLKLNYRPVPPITIYSSFATKASFLGRFREDDGSQYTLTAGIRWDFCKSGCHVLAPMTGLNLRASHTTATDPSKEATAYQFGAELRWNLDRLGEGMPVNIFGFADPFISVEVTRRVFDHLDAPSGLERRDWDYFVLAGIDITDWAKENLFRGDWADNLKAVRLGYRYSEIVSTVPDRERSTRAILPVITFFSTF